MACSGHSGLVTSNAQYLLIVVVNRNGDAWKDFVVYGAVKCSEVLTKGRFLLSMGRERNFK